MLRCSPICSFQCAYVIELMVGICKLENTFVADKKKSQYQSIDLNWACWLTPLIPAFLKQDCPKFKAILDYISVRLWGYSVRDPVSKEEKNKFSSIFIMLKSFFVVSIEKMNVRKFSINVIIFLILFPPTWQAIETLDAYIPVTKLYSCIMCFNK